MGLWSWVVCDKKTHKNIPKAKKTAPVWVAAVFKILFILLSSLLPSRRPSLSLFDLEDCLFCCLHCCDVKPWHCCHASAVSAQQQRTALYKKRSVIIAIWRTIFVFIWLRSYCSRSQHVCELGAVLDCVIAANVFPGAAQRRFWDSARAHPQHSHCPHQVHLWPGD